MTSHHHVSVSPTPPDPPPGEDAQRAGPPPSGRRSTWSLLRPALLRLHFYAGILVAPFILIAAITGLLYTFTPQIEEVLYADELHVPVGEERLPLSEQVAAATSAHPEGTLSGVRPAEAADESTRVLLDVPGMEESHRLGAFVNPYTGEVRGALESYGSSGSLPVRAWLAQFHRNLHLGDAGHLYSELAASWVWVVAAGGVALWVSKRRGKRRLRAILAPDSQARGRSRTMSWHGSVGVWAAAGLLVLSATGLSWSTYAGDNISKIREAMQWQTPALSAAAPDSGHSGHGAHGAGVEVDRVLESAREAGLDGPVEVSYPEAEGAAYAVTQTRSQWPTQKDSVAVDPHSGQVVEELRFADYPLMAKLTTWGIAAHMGLLFGLANQLLLATLALSVIGLVIWGYRMWWQRRPTAGGSFSLGRPIPRGAWRNLPIGTRVLIVLAAAGIGYLMPVLGVSLLLFLAVDMAVAARERRRSRAAPPRAGAERPS
ncbi:PepSY-associated TM helix domain-containing protein [Allosalinactinospora lopnorensis]|uniref:PepSY-associated TM helix domain-containing protein n=1 Tax=Allosalinactinospora lopnorensis TaxID=1352348 RepID=UPI000623CB11|nr:PepSY domain-containing protein [Allosalinactinospora lopnorensis]